jgi:hypothetical protein
VPSIAPVIAVAGGGSTSTTVPPTPTTTKAPATTPTSGGGGGGATPVAAKSSSLAFTGVGPGVGILGVIGGVLILLGLALLVLIDAPRRAIEQLAFVRSPTTWRHRRAGQPRDGHLTSDATTEGGQLMNSGLRLAKRTTRWLLGR